MSQASPLARSRRRAGGRSPLGLVADHRPLVASRRRARDRGRPRRARLGRRRRDRGKAKTLALPRPAVHDLRAAARSRASRRTRRPSARSSAPRPRSSRRRSRAACTVGQLRGHVTSQAVDGRGQAQEHLAARRDHGRRPGAAQGREGGRRSGAIRDRPGRPTYVDQKIALLKEQIASSKTELEDIDARITPFQEQQQSLQSDKSNLRDRQADRGLSINQYDRLRGAAARDGAAGALPEPAAAVAGGERREEPDRAACRRRRA